MKSRTVSRLEAPLIEPDGSDIRRLKILVRPGAWDATDPFILLGEDWYRHGAFEDHPHRGLETVTYVIDGSLSHFDNHGNRGIINAGEALWMTAGRGIVHNELPVDDKQVHVLQLWLNLPRKDKFVPASYQELKGEAVGRRVLPGAEVVVFSGSSGDVQARTQNYTALTMVEIRLAAHTSFVQEIPAGHNGFVVILEGDGMVGATAVQKGHVAWLSRENEESQVTVTSGGVGARMILYSGAPLGEPLAVKGPFVMNTSEEIEQAYADYRRDRERFGLT